MKSFLLIGWHILCVGNIRQIGAQAIFPNHNPFGGTKPSFKHKMYSSHIFWRLVCRKRGRLGYLLAAFLY
jgi:hypothetical protein